MQQALLLCPAHTSGLSLLHKNDRGQFFHWDAMAGVLRDKVGGTTPRNFSPCEIQALYCTPVLNLSAKNPWDATITILMTLTIILASA